MIAASLVLIVLALMGAPLFIVIAASAILGFIASEVDLTVVIIEIYRLVDMQALVSIPLFTLAGYVLSESNASQRLVRFINALFGWLPGGVAIVALIACAFFTALTGASGVTIVALGALLYPALQQAGYGERFSLGLITSSGSLGLLFPPSIALILYGVIAQQLQVSEPVLIDDLFLAGLLPGLLMVLLLSLWSMWVYRKDVSPSRTITHAGVSDRKEIIAATREAIWEIPLPAVILGGIFSGYFAISEAAAVAVVYVLLVEVLFYKDISLKQLPGIMRESMTLVGAILLILGASLASTNYLIDAEVPARIFEAIREHVDSRITFLLMLNVFLMVLGMILDIFSALVIMVPILLPIAAGYGIHPVHLGIIFLANMQIGYFTPPVGINLFIASHRFKKPITELYMSTLPYMAILLLAVIIITYWPDLSLVFIKH
ncbi:MAG: TRAP transporter large permease subunit [Gammaproteobacteria bacterium]|nr:TRAP transporter large permease subunit [Gammaproteobacteria bacterium]